MITCTKIEQDGTDYLFKHSKQEYLSEQDNEVGIFKGTLAKWNKLDGKVATKELFDKQMSFNKEFKGVEIDPSPCKDFSVLYNRVSPEEREVMKQIWSEAMNEVCKTIEQNTYYRETKNGKTEYKLAKAVCFAQFDHHTARPVAGYTDFQIHSHIVAFPMVMGQDNKFHSHTLLDLKYEKNNHETLRMIDSVMNYHLGKGVSEKLGYGISPTENGFSIDCITDDVKKQFSKRTNSINEAVGEKASYAEKKAFSIKVRENKSSNNIEELRKTWQADMDSRGFTSDKLFKSTNKPINKTLSELSDSKNKCVFSNKELKMMAYQTALFSGKSVSETLKEFKDDKKLMTVSKKHSVFMKNHLMTKVAKELKSLTLANSLATSRSSRAVAKPSKPNPSAKPSTATPSFTTQINQPNQAMFMQSSISGETVEECMSEIKCLEKQLSSLKLDDPKRANIESQIGNLKTKAKNILAEGKTSMKASAYVADKQQQSNKNEDYFVETDNFKELAYEIKDEKRHLAMKNLGEIANKLIALDVEKNQIEIKEIYERNKQKQLSL